MACGTRQTSLRLLPSGPDLVRTAHSTRSPVKGRSYQEGRLSHNLICQDICVYFIRRRIILAMKIWIVDAFTAQPYRGNPAAVVIVEEFPGDPECLNISSEMNLSETAFIRPLGRDHYHLRWFTPKVEVRLCGHGTLASSHILCQEKFLHGKEILFESLSGPLKVYCDFPQFTLDFPLQPIGGAVRLPPFLQQRFGKILCAVQAYDDILIEVASEREVRDFIPDFEAICKLDAQGLILTAKGTGEYDFVSRVFAPKKGVNEDPVTGSAHCKLADYWAPKLGKSQFIACQASKRGGILQVKVLKDRVHLTGQAMTIMEGDWKIPF